MDKCMDGFFAFRDSHSALKATLDRRHYVSIAFVDGAIIVTPQRGAELDVIDAERGIVKVKVVEQRGDAPEVGEKDQRVRAEN